MTHESISDLLKAVEPNLVRNYETNVFVPHGRGSLAMLNQEYEALASAPQTFPSQSGTVLLDLLLATVPLSLIAFTRGRYVLVDAACVASFIILAAVSPLTRRRLRKRMRRRRRISEITPFLSGFRTAVLALKDPTGKPMSEYTADTIRRSFFSYAALIVSTERKLDVVRAAKHVDAQRLYDLSGVLLRLRLRMADAEDKAALLGLRYDDVALRQEAEEAIDQAHRPAR